jgi:methionine-rich copper-binding protein CopC
VFAGALLVTVLPAVVAAHAELETSTPADGATVESPFDGPIVLDFSAALVEGSQAELIGPSGSIVTESTVGPGATMTLNPVGVLASGLYEVRWTSIAEDGDVARGTFGFTVAPAPPTPEPTAEPTPPPAASATPAASSPPATAAPSEAPSPSPTADGGGTAGTGDMLLPIIVALLVVGAGAAYLLTRRNRPILPG